MHKVRDLRLHTPKQGCSIKSLPYGLSEPCKRRGGKSIRDREDEEDKETRLSKSTWAMLRWTTERDWQQAQGLHKSVSGPLYMHYDFHFSAFMGVLNELTCKSDSCAFSQGLSLLWFLLFLMLLLCILFILFYCGIIP